MHPAIGYQPATAQIAAHHRQAGRGHAGRAPTELTARGFSGASPSGLA
jgi:hypothetical protein